MGVALWELSGVVEVSLASFVSPQDHRVFASIQVKAQFQKACVLCLLV